MNGASTMIFQTKDSLESEYFLVITFWKVTTAIGLVYPEKSLLVSEKVSQNVSLRRLFFWVSKQQKLFIVKILTKLIKSDEKVFELG